MEKFTFSATGFIKSINLYNSKNGGYDFLVLKGADSTIGISIFDNDLMEQIEDHEGELVEINGTVNNYKTRKGEFKINFTASSITFKDTD